MLEDGPSVGGAERWSWPVLGAAGSVSTTAGLRDAGLEGLSQGTLASARHRLGICVASHPIISTVPDPPPGPMVV